MGASAESLRVEFLKDHCRDVHVRSIAGRNVMRSQTRKEFLG